MQWLPSFLLSLCLTSATQLELFLYFNFWSFYFWRRRCQRNLGWLDSLLTLSCRDIFLFCCVFHVHFFEVFFLNSKLKWKWDWCICILVHVNNACMLLDGECITPISRLIVTSTHFRVMSTRDDWSEGHTGNWCTSCIATNSHQLTVWSSELAIHNNNCKIAS